MEDLTKLRELLRRIAPDALRAFDAGLPLPERDTCWYEETEGGLRQLVSERVMPGRDADWNKLLGENEEARELAAAAQKCSACREGTATAHLCEEHAAWVPRCGECGSYELTTTQESVEGVAVPVRHCKCGFSFRDHEAESIQTEHVLQERTLLIVKLRKALETRQKAGHAEGCKGRFPVATGTSPSWCTCGYKQADSLLKKMKEIK